MISLIEYQRSKMKATEMDGMMVFVDGDIDELHFLEVTDDTFKTSYWIKETPKSDFGCFCDASRLFIQQI